MKGGKEAPTKPKGRPKKHRENDDVSFTPLAAENTSLGIALTTDQRLSPPLSSMDTDQNSEFIDVD